jgi:hypothetical protein
MLKINDVVRIVNLPNDEEMNDRLALVVSEEYVHPVMYVSVVRIKIGCNLWGIHLKNVEKVCEAERVEFFRSLEGNEPAKWSDCVWNPLKKDIQNG